MWTGTKTTSACSQVTFSVRFVRIHTAICRAGDGQAPHNLGEQMHEGPLIGHPLPLQRKRMCQRHPLAAWPPGRGGIRRPKRPSSHGGAGPGCTTVEREPKTPLASLGGPCETSTLVTLVRRPQIHTFPLGAAHHHFNHSASGPVGRDVHMPTHATHSIHPSAGQPERQAGSRGMT